MNVAWGLLWRGSRSNVIAGLVRRVLRVSALRSYMVLWKPWLQNALQWLHACVGEEAGARNFLCLSV